VSVVYLPSAFAENRVEVLHALMRAHPLATVVVHTRNGLDASHIPMVVRPDPGPYGTLQGHVARANRMWSEYDPGVEVLAVFHGLDGYITPSWSTPTARCA